MTFGSLLSQTEETEWRNRRGGREREKLCNWAGREDYVTLPRCWDVYVISPLNLSSTFVTLQFLLHKFNLCQASAVSSDREDWRQRWTLGPYCNPASGTAACSVDGPPFYNPGPFPVPEFPPNTKQTSPSVSLLFRIRWVCRKWGITPISWHISKSFDIAQCNVLYCIYNIQQQCVLSKTMSPLVWILVEHPVKRFGNLVFQGFQGKLFNVDYIEDLSQQYLKWWHFAVNPIHSSENASVDQPHAVVAVLTLQATETPKWRKSELYIYLFIKFNLTSCGVVKTAAQKINGLQTVMRQESVVQMYLFKWTVKISRSLSFEFWLPFHHFFNILSLVAFSGHFP